MAASVRRGLLFVWLALLSLACGVLLVRQAGSEPRVAKFEQIDVQRINVVEPDGKPRLVLSNRSLFPGLYWGGKEFRHHSRDTGGMLFYNSEGDEVGGLTFDGRRQGADWGANAGLMFDQFKQDQTVGIEYSEQNGQRRAGLRVWERPNQSMLPLVELSDQIAAATSDEQRAQLRTQMLGIAQQWGPMGERLFVGKQLDESVVRLADKQGRPRLVLKVDGAGEPSVEFLDPAGKVVRRIPEK
jgi:hypothetical protein